MGIRDRPTSFRSPWQNGYVERLIGSIRRECTDHLLVFNAEHLRRILGKYATYYKRFGPTFRSGRMRPADGPSNGSATLSRIRSLATTPSLCSNLVFGSDNGNLCSGQGLSILLARNVALRRVHHNTPQPVKRPIE